MPPRSVLIAKRIIDVAAAGLGLAITAPLFPAIAIKLDSPGPIIYRQRRAHMLEHA